MGDAPTRIVGYLDFPDIEFLDDRAFDFREEFFDALGAFEEADIFPAEILGKIVTCPKGKGAEHNFRIIYFGGYDFCKKPVDCAISTSSHHNDFVDLRVTLFGKGVGEVKTHLKG